VRLREIGGDEQTGVETVDPTLDGVNLDRERFHEAE
jgi:hypothetical protein